MKMASVFEIYVKVYMKAAALYNDGIFHGKTIQRTL